MPLTDPQVALCAGRKAGKRGRYKKCPLSHQVSLSTVPRF
jgi:hypothetical protein